MGAWNAVPREALPRLSSWNTTYPARVRICVKEEPVQVSSTR